MITTVRGWYLEAVRTIGVANQYRRSNPVAALIARAYAQECLMQYEAEINRLLPTLPYMVERRIERRGPSPR